MRSRPLVAVLLLGVMAQGLAGQEEDGRDGGDGLVTGRVVDQASGGAISGARVVLGEAGITGVTDGQGLFQFFRVESGTHVLLVEHIGYGPVQDTVEVPEGGRLDLTIRLVTRPLELEPVVVAVEYAGSPRLRGFYQRRRTGMGSYLTRADFEDQTFTYVTDALRMVSGVRLLPRAGGNAVLLRGCMPAVYIDGTRLADRAVSIDEVVHPNDIEGIEIYRGPQTPVAYVPPGGCGAVLIWTRPGGGRGRLAFWKGALIAGVFLTLATLLTN